MGYLARITVYPVKSLDGVERRRTRIRDGGGLAGDREYAVVDEEGAFVNGKRTAAVHRLRASFEFEDGSPTKVVLRAHGGGPNAASFSLPDDRAAMGEWFDDYFDAPASVRHDPEGMPDDRAAAGPTVVSTATLETVADWFDLSVESVRRRFRANLEVGGVDPFWEDRLYAADGPGRFRVGDAELVATGPCNRCVVPTRDPDTGESIAEFQERFAGRRETTLPPWAPAERFDHYYKLAVNTRVPETEWGTVLSVDDPVSVLDAADPEPDPQSGTEPEPEP